MPEKELTTDELKSSIVEITKNLETVTAEKERYKRAFETLVDRINGIVGISSERLLDFQIVIGEMAKVARSGFVEKSLPPEQNQEVRQIARKA